MGTLARLPPAQGGASALETVHGSLLGFGRFRPAANLLKEEAASSLGGKTGAAAFRCGARF